MKLTRKIKKNLVRCDDCGIVYEGEPKEEKHLCAFCEEIELRNKLKKFVPKLKEEIFTEVTRILDKRLEAV